MIRPSIVVVSKPDCPWQAHEVLMNASGERLVRKAVALYTAAKKAEKMIDHLLEGYAPSPAEIQHFRDVLAHIEKP